MQISSHITFEQATEEPAPSMRILVIEDDREAASWLIKGLTESGHVADLAAFGQRLSNLPRKASPVSYCWSNPAAASGSWRCQQTPADLQTSTNSNVRRQSPHIPLS